MLSSLTNQIKVSINKKDVVKVYEDDLITGKRLLFKIDMNNLPLIDPNKEIKTAITEAIVRRNVKALNNLTESIESKVEIKQSGF